MFARERFKLASFWARKCVYRDKPNIEVMWRSRLVALQRQGVTISVHVDDIKLHIICDILYKGVT